MVDAIKENHWRWLLARPDFGWSKAIAAEKNVPVESTTLKFSTSSTPSSKSRWRNIDSTNVYGPPVAVSPLAKKNPERPHASLTFRALHHDKEYGNTFTRWTLSINCSRTRSTSCLLRTRWRRSNRHRLRLRWNSRSRCATNRWTQSVSTVSASRGTTTIRDDLVVPNDEIKIYNLDTDKYYRKKLTS